MGKTGANNHENIKDEDKTAILKNFGGAIIFL